MGLVAFVSDAKVMTGRMDELEYRDRIEIDGVRKVKIGGDKEGFTVGSRSR